ncbi:MAG: DNA polymerase IV [Clostridiales bacterium]|nr:DNA polymerase IV [Clostridiales bacterium]
MRAIMHVDANSAYLSWTAVDMLEHGYPLDVRTVPSAIAGNPGERRGIILTKSIPAKRCGIKTGESIRAALEKCPDLLVFPPDYDLYMACSDAMYGILSRYSGCIERYSVDESWLDCSGASVTQAGVERVAYEIKGRVKKELGFTVNIGVSVNKLLAKMASELRKPDMVHTLFPEEIPVKMWPLPVDELFYVGRATKKKLRGIGIGTIGALAAESLDVVKATLKPVHGTLVWEYAHGIDDTPVANVSALDQKGVGNSTTTPFDVVDPDEARLFLLAISERVAHRLRKLSSYARVVHISIRRGDEGLTFAGRQHRLDRYIGTTDEIYDEAVRLLGTLWEGEPLRHFGVHVTELMRTDRLQTSIFDRGDAGRLARIDAAVDRIRAAYGDRAIVRGAFVHSGIDAIQGGVNDGHYLLMGGHAL